MLGVVFVLLNLVVALSGETIVFNKDFTEETSGQVPRYRRRETVPYSEDGDYQKVGIEKRFYPEAKWVVSEEKCPLLKAEICRDDAVKRLREYYDGENDKLQEMPLTVPLTEEYYKSSAEGVVNFTVAMYIPHAFQNNTPVPSDPLVKLVDAPDVHVYTRTYSGYSTKLTFMKELTKLKGLLHVFNLTYSDEKSIFAEYDRSWQRLFRRNEVWLIAT